MMDYRLDVERVASALEELDRRRYLFAHFPLDPTHVAWFRHRAWVRTVHGTTKIEGNTLSDFEVEDLLGGMAARGSRKEALEILGSQDSIVFVDEIAGRDDVAIDEAVVREIHRRVLSEIDPMLTPGSYRRGPNRVVDASGRTIFTTPPSGDVPGLMRAFGLWTRTGSDGRPAAVAAAVAHLEFVAIHPFYDGNGRTARAIARLLLLRGGFGFDGLVSLDGQLDHERVPYFAAINASTGGQYEPGYDATPFVEYFVGAAVRATDHLLSRVRGLGEVMIALRRAIIHGDLPPAMLDGLAYAWINRSLRPADYTRITGRANASATRDLAVATRLGYLEARGATRMRRYVLGPMLAGLGEPEA